MKHKPWKNAIITIATVSLCLLFYVATDPAQAQGPENFALASWSVHSGVTASGGDFSLNTTIGQGSAGTTSSGGEFALTSGAFTLNPDGENPEPPKDELIFLPIVRR